MDMMDQVVQQESAAIPMPEAPLPEALQGQMRVWANEWFEDKEANATEAQ